MTKKILALIFILYMSFLGYTQTTLSTPQTISSDTYIRDGSIITLLPGFGYGAGSSSPLLNLNISQNPSFVPNGYSQTPFSNLCDLTPYLLGNFEVGETAGEFNVSPAGGAAYNIQIFTPPGTAGMQPILSIGYNSDAKDGLMGVGWSLSGLSAITRVRKNPYFESTFEPVELSTNDVFSFNGMRLLLKTGAYGSNGATYSTENESFSTITSLGSQGNGPQSFTVLDKNGNLLEFGKTSNSRLTGIGTNLSVLSWFLEKVTDEYGNYMEFSYKQLSGEIVIDKIQYTGNSSAGISPYNSIEFEYMDKAEKNSYYAGGVEFRTTQLLKSIKVMAESSQIKKYNFDYVFSKSTLLAKISETTADNRELRPTLFCWTNPMNTSNVPPSANLPLFINSSEFTNLDRVVTADFDGNGFSDALCIYMSSSSKFYKLKINQYQYSNISSPNLAFDHSIPVQPNPDLQNADKILGINVLDADMNSEHEVYSIINNTSNLKQYKIQKITGGGSLIQNPTIKTVVLQNNINTSIDPLPFFYDLNDYTKDGRNDEVIIDPENITITGASGNFNSSASFNLTGNSPFVRPIDFNGDGSLDFIILTKNTTNTTINYEVRTFNASSSQFTQLTSGSISFPNNGSFNSNLYKLLGFGDYNGDGKTDILYLNESKANMFVLYSNGATFITAKQIQGFNSITPNNVDYSITSIDINSDGKSDVIITNNIDNTLTNGVNNYFSYYSYGDVFQAGPVAKGKWTLFEKKELRLVRGFDYFGIGPYAEYVSTGETTPVLAHDFDLNGDGVFDAISLKDLSHQSIIFNDITEVKSDVIGVIRTGLGKEVAIKYANTNTGFDPDKKFIYRNSSSTTYNFPLVNLKPSKTVVSEVNYRSILGLTSINDPQISNTFRYVYSDAIWHRNGKGFLGFEKIMSFHTSQLIATQKINTFNTTFFVPLNTENATGKVVTSFPLSGITAYQLDNNTLSTKTTVSFFQLPFPVSTSKGYFIAPNTVFSKDYLASTGQRTSYSYALNQAGRPIGILTEYLWSTGTPIRNENTLLTWSAEGLSTNKIFKLKTIKTEWQQGSDPKYTREAQYNYDGLGHLTDIIKDNTLGNQSLTIKYASAFYNAFGQPTQIELQAGNLVPNNRISNVQYDQKGRFITKTINSLGHFEEFTYEPAFGNIISTKDKTGLINSYKYDGLGRLIEAQLADGTVNTTKYENVVPIYQPSLRNGIYAITTFNEGAPYSKDYFDSYNRHLRNETQGFGGQTIFIDQFYDNFGRFWQETEPYYSSSSLSPNYLVTKYTYESGLFSRILSTQAYTRINNNTPVLSEPTVDISTNYAYNAISTDANYVQGFVTVGDQSGRAVKKFINVAGQTATVQNTYGGTTFQNSFNTYHSNGQLKNHSLSYGFNNLTPFVTHNFSYNNLGQQIQLIDPSLGTINYDYNAIGELMHQDDALGSYDYAYDAIGRLISRSNGSSIVTNYQYVSSGNGLEQISKIIGPNVTNEYQYDNLNRAIENKETLPGNKVFKTTYSYDKYSRIQNYTYPSGFSTKYEYDGLGYMTAIKNAGNNAPIWQLDAMGALNEVKQYTYGNGIQTTNTFNNLHFLTQIDFGSHHQQVYGYAHFSKGYNIEKRNFNKLVSAPVSLYEKFSYNDPHIDRLTEFVQTDNTYNPLTSVQPTQTLFDPSGNITKKTDAGDYVYGQPTKPFNLTNINNATNNISLNTLSMTYNDVRKVKQISEATTNRQMDFTYGNDDQRLKVDYSISSINQYSRYYCQNYDREESAGGTNIKDWSYIYAPSGLAAVYYSINGSGQLYYINTDHLGSPVMLTDNSQGVVEEYSFDAWGRRRDPATWAYNTVTQPQFLNRGFTFHEHIDEFNLINMNGRVYDPILARFLQPDNLVQDVNNINTYNPYSYVGNNPLMHTDPSGHFYGIALFAGEFALLSVNNLVEGGHSAPVKDAWNETSTMFNDVKNILSFTSSYGSTQVTAGIDPFSMSLFTSMHQQNGNFDYTLTFGYGLNGGYVFGNVGYSKDDWRISTGGGLFENGYGYGGDISYKGYGVGYYQTVYGKSSNNPTGVPNNQKVGGVSIFGPNWSFRLENDFLSQSGDRWRTNAWELQIGKFAVGSSIYTNDPGGMEGSREEKTDFAGTDLRGNTNKHGNGAWIKGLVYDSPIWVGYNYGPGVSKIGYSHPRFQDSQQNAIHLYFPPGYQNFYNNYTPSAYGYYGYNGYYNPYSLWGK